MEGRWYFVRILLDLASMMGKLTYTIRYLVLQYIDDLTSCAFKTEVRHIQNSKLQQHRPKTAA